ncbi:MAG TPA: PadR family transcriptional regulator [Gemmatimonadaceae bacterium]|nr:PadR family transcriptional regulator [Gemmatimonadaceae bacterium]
MCGSYWYGGAGHRRGWAGGGRRGWGFDPAYMAAFWGAPGARRGGAYRGSRMFGHGDLKYVILQLLDEKPRHGYEIIKELEDRFGGAYSPSPGTVYPTLTMLEDLGYARSVAEDGGKRIYEITTEGKAYLEQNKSTVEGIFDRIAEFGATFFSAPMGRVNGAVRDLARSVYGAAARGGGARDAERLEKIADILERARREIDELSR